MDTERDRVVTYEIGFEPEADVSDPVLLQTEAGAYLTFNAVKMLPDDGRGPTGTAVIEILGCLVTKFGYPNDEALPGHPLYSRGLGYYGVFEVTKSSWIDLMNDQNRVSFPNTKEDSTSRHFIFTFHDSTFECVARDLRASFSTESCETIIPRLFQRMHR